MQLSVIKNIAKRSPKKRKQQLVFQRSRRRFPIDIEIRSEGRIWPELQHIHPPSIFLAGSHMIRHKIQHKPHAAFFKRGLKRRKSFFPPFIKVDFRWVGDVISVTTSAAAPKNR